MLDTILRLSSEQTLPGADFNILRITCMNWHDDHQSKVLWGVVFHPW
jgi:hypothetical protein